MLPPSISGKKRGMMATTTTRRPRITQKTTPMPTADPNDICADGSVDAIIMTEGTGREIVYAFRKDYYFILESDGIHYDYPRPINWDWRGLPDNIDAAITLSPRLVIPHKIMQQKSANYAFEKR